MCHFSSVLSYRSSSYKYMYSIRTAEGVVVDATEYAALAKDAVQTAIDFSTEDGFAINVIEIKKKEAAVKYQYQYFLYFTMGIDAKLFSKFEASIQTAFKAVCKYKGFKVYLQLIQFLKCW